jgi:hypothetical protein
MLSGYLSWKFLLPVRFPSTIPQTRNVFASVTASKCHNLYWYASAVELYQQKVKVDLCLYTLGMHTNLVVGLHLFLTSALEGSEWLTLRPNLFIPEKGPGTHWVGPKAGLDIMEKRKSPVLTGIRTPDDEALSLVTKPYQQHHCSVFRMASGSNFVPENRLHLLKIFLVFLRPSRKVLRFCHRFIF